MKASSLLLRAGIPAAAAIAIVWFGFLLLRQPAEAATEDIVLHCASLHQGCAFDGMRISTRTPPSANHPFVVDVVAPTQPVLSFEMADMAMGVARFTPARQAGDRWQAQVGLPVCISGSSAWLMTIEVGGKRYQLPFTAESRGAEPAAQAR